MNRIVSGHLLFSMMFRGWDGSIYEQYSMLYLHVKPKGVGCICSGKVSLDHVH